MQMAVKERTPAALGRRVAGVAETAQHKAYSSSDPASSENGRIFIRLPLKVATDRRLTRADLTVFGVLSLHSGYSDSTTWVSLRRVAEVAGLSLRQVRRSVKRLIRMRYVQVITHGGRSLYVISTERPYVKLHPVILWDKRVPRAALAIYCALANYARNKGVCWPTIHQLARRTGQNPRVVRRELRRLEGLGYLRTEASNPGWGRGHRTVYWLQQIEEMHDTCELATVPAERHSEPARRCDKRRTTLSSWPLEGGLETDLHGGVSADGLAANGEFSSWPVHSDQLGKWCSGVDKAATERGTELSSLQGERDSERDPEIQVFEKGIAMSQKEDIPVRERRTSLSAPTVETNVDLNCAEANFFDAELDVVEQDINNIPLGAYPGSDEPGARPEGLASGNCTQASSVKREGQGPLEKPCRRWYHEAAELQKSTDNARSELFVDPVIRYAKEKYPFRYTLFLKLPGGYERLKQEYENAKIS